jgi:hypothetical protein
MIKDIEKRKKWAKQYGQQYYIDNKETIKTKQKKYNLKNKESSKRRSRKHLMKRYNLTIEEYNKLFNIQNGKCAICGRHQNELIKALAVDHNHITGNVRGLICVRCNRAIGMFEDNISLLEKAIVYLKK